MLRAASRMRGVRARQASRAMSALLDAFATVDPKEMSGAKPHTVQNLLGGKWVDSAKHDTVVDPLNGEAFLRVPATQESELDGFVSSLRSCPGSGLHNPLKSPERYVMYGDVSARAAAALRDPSVSDFFTRLIQRTSPKSYAQAEGEVRVTRVFLENFSGDSVRFLARGFSVPGDHPGQQSHGYRWPFGAVAVIAPFNFPVEIPVLQLMGALYMGNKPVLKVDSKVSVAAEQFLRLLHHCGMPAEDCDFINSDGPVMNQLLLRAQPANTLFTGSSTVAKKLARDLLGKVRLEDAGFDWKILGPDVSEEEYVAWVCDQDAYASSGQKCSAQSVLFAHRNWTQRGLFDRLRALAARRSLADLTIGPVLTWTTEAILEHVRKLEQIPGAKVLFGAKELADHSIPKVYGAVEPTAVFVPLEAVTSDEHFELVTTEVFGPLQVVTEYGDGQLDDVLSVMERMEHHLTAAVVSNDPHFINYVAGRTVNGTTYAGIRARTTGAPQNHWFGPCGDPRGAGIGTREAIQHTWSAHREVITDVGPVPDGWTTPEAT